MNWGGDSDLSSATDFLTFKKGNLVLLNSLCCVGFVLHLWPLAFSGLQ